MRNEWFGAPDQGARRAVARRPQLQAFADVPYVPLGRYFAPTAHRANMTGTLKGNPVFWKRA